MSEEAVVAAEGGSSSSEEQWKPERLERKSRFPRACTSRPSPRLYPPPERRPSPAVVAAARRDREERQQNARIITPLSHTLSSPSQLPRWSIRSMSELASLLNFLHIFRPLLNIRVEFTAEELETALITPNSTLGDIHIPLLKAIPPIIRMALGRATWITVLCRKLKDWWHWVSDGDVPIFASHGMEIEMYQALDPGVRLVILKAICDIRVEQEDIRHYIEDSLKHGIQLSLFRRERVGGDSHGVSYWYEDDPIIGHRLYREIRRFESSKVKGKAVPSPQPEAYQWETVATNFDEFQEVSEKLFSSKNRTEAALGKKLRIDFLPEIEKVQKRKDKLFKKQHRQALLLDSFLTSDSLTAGRSLRDRKPVTYTFDDYDRSINEAIKITKKRQNSPEQVIIRKESNAKFNSMSNGKGDDSPEGPEHYLHQNFSNSPSPKLNEYEEFDPANETEPLVADDIARRERRRKRPQRYSENNFVEAVSDEADFDSDDDIVGEAVYDEEYLRSRKQRKMVSSSDGDEEYRWEEENAEEDEEEEEESSLSTSEDSNNGRQMKRSARTRRERKLRSVDELQSGLRRSRRSRRVNYQQYDWSDSDTDNAKPNKSNSSNEHPEEEEEEDQEALASGHESHTDEEHSEKLEDQQLANGDNNIEIHENQPSEERQTQPLHSAEKSTSDEQEEAHGAPRRFLDLNELAPGTGFEDGSGSLIKDEEDANNFK